MLQPHEALFLAETIPDCVPTVFAIAALSPCLAAIAFLSKRYFAEVDRTRARLQRYEEEAEADLKRMGQAK